MKLSPNLPFQCACQSNDDNAITAACGAHMEWYRRRIREEGFDPNGVTMDRLKRFLHDWRRRLTANRRVEYLTEEEMGQLIMLNTIIYYVEHP